ncbi:MAG TPA: 3-hydroxyacyl-ACP dehydratase FabZ [Candidatus Pullichristensenella excrementigallinarum]|uniref:3-hydroxyacyl-ACP dehydratase FabZ n=1 Tax=Candidatus Pullichristensenella excrementigallinarum TaxID=2840907 RepID=A0A9D1IDJ9_9FIRM|nr:3-hydroxyacyl-ACP dehydratase FabZ [Candidatus Pullichristensenella excrementigallinarum]
MNREELMEILPHRENMLLVDSAELLEDGTAQGTYRVRGDEFFLRGHFPGNPVVPGVILLEIMAQTACVLFQEQLKGSLALYAGVDKARFRGIVRPGDTLNLSATLLRSKLGLYVIRGEARVEDKLVASGELSFMLVKN